MKSCKQVMNKLYLFTISYFPGWVGGWVGWWVGGWLKFLLILRLTQPSLAGVGAGAELGNTFRMIKENVKINKDSKLNCQGCGNIIKSDNEEIWKVNLESKYQSPYYVKDILMVLIQMYGHKECCRRSIIHALANSKILVLSLSSPSDVYLYSSQEAIGTQIKYVSHIETNVGCNQTFFKHKHEMVYQDSNSNILMKGFGVHENVKFLYLSFEEQIGNLRTDPIEDLIYGNQLQKFLQKKYLSVVDPNKFQEKYKEQQIKMQEYDQVRDKTKERQARDKDPKRKEMHDNYDKTPKRKLLRQIKDKKIYQKEERKFYITVRNTKRNYSNPLIQIQDLI